MKQGKPPALFTRMALALGSIFGGFRDMRPPTFAPEALTAALELPKVNPTRLYRSARRPVHRRSVTSLKYMDIFQLARYAKRGQLSSATAEFNRRLNKGATWRSANFNAARQAKFDAWVRNAAV
jgi:hypothetical protein